MKNLAHQLIRESGMFSADEEKWITILLRLSRIASDFVSEEMEDWSASNPVDSAGIQSPAESVVSSFLSPSFHHSWDEPLSSLESKVNVIEIEGSIPEQSVFVDGYMMKKNLAHKVLSKGVS